MEGKDLADWHAFENELEELRGRYKESPTKLLFRGQSNSDWKLTTTLERHGVEGMTFFDYCTRAGNVRPAVETFTGVQWSDPEFSECISSSWRFEPELMWFNRFPSFQLYRYLVYLRHNGFPSPLLDWTRSPFVAAFFAFRDPVTKSCERRSIYVYCEMPKGHKGGALGQPVIRAFGPYVRSHPRHFRQQSDYTICGELDPNRGWVFRQHEPNFGGRGEQDFLWKFNLPSSECIPVLRSLDEHNLNAFSLFDSEEALLETMWFREHILRTRQ